MRVSGFIMFVAFAQNSIRGIDALAFGAFPHFEIRAGPASACAV